VYTQVEERSISASHVLPRPDGSPGAVHGHNFRFVAAAEGLHLDGRGELLPSGTLGQALEEAIAPLDHRHWNDLEPFRPQDGGPPPSVAVIARRVAEALARRVDDGRVRLAWLEVWTDAAHRIRYELPRPGGGGASGSGAAPDASR
jgi:6-pyruvoyl-tetrahydropterin synthase